jgi:voltage-gated potassium channel
MDAILSRIGLPLKAFSVQNWAMNLRTKFQSLISSLVGLLTFGTFGFHFIEGWRWLDSIYATVVTLGTVGYGDFTPKDDMGKIFVIVLIIIGLGVISYAALELTAFVVEGHLNKMLRMRRVDTMIKKVQGHYIVCGAGRTGRHIIGELIKNKVPFVVIDRDVDALDMPEIHAHPHITGDATDDAVLERAGIKKAKGLAAALETDELNLFLMLTAKNLNPKVRCVSKLVNETARIKMGRAGADAVVAPNAIGGLRLASEMLRPNVVSFLDIMIRGSKGVRFEEAAIPERSPAAGKTLETLHLQKRFGINPIAVRDGGKDFHYNPPPSYHLKAGDTLVVIAEPDRLVKLRKFLGEKSV